MNSDILKGKWKQIKGKVQSKWGKLTEDDFDKIDGDADRLIGKIQERYGKSKEQAKKEVEDYLDSL